MNTTEYGDDPREITSVAALGGYIWRWVQARHVVVQVALWLIFWWLLAPIFIWQTSLHLWIKILLSIPFILFFIHAIPG
jgi:hypothetical protein